MPLLFSHIIAGIQNHDERHSLIHSGSKPHMLSCFVRLIIFNLAGVIIIMALLSKVCDSDLFTPTHFA